MATIKIGTVDVTILARTEGGWRVLVLQRGTHTRCPASWETVHGSIEDGEEPEDAALRELFEETGLKPERLYSIRVQPFYILKTRTIDLAVGFAAIVNESSPIVLAGEHQAFEWLSSEEALQRLVWPAERTALRECLQLLADGNAGPVEDALRVI